MTLVIRDQLVCPPTWFLSYRDLTLYCHVFLRLSIVLESEDADTYYRWIKPRGGMDFVEDIIRPGTELFHWASLFAVASAAGYAVYQVLTRRIAGIDPPETSTIYSSVVGGFGMFLVLPFVWRTPESLRDILYFCSLGVLGGLGHYFVARALTNAPANIVSPFQYMQLLGSVAVGYVFFGDFPDFLGWVGAAIIVAAGLYIGWSQRKA